MATRFYGIGRGDDAATAAGSTTSEEMELAVNDAVGITKKDIALALERIAKAVKEDEAFTEI